MGQFLSISHEAFTLWTRYTFLVQGRPIYYVRREGEEGGVEKLDQNANAVREVA